MTAPFLSSPSKNVAFQARTAFLSGVYLTTIALSFYLAYEVRFDFAVPPEQQALRLRLIALVMVAKMLTLISARQLGSLMTFFSIPDLIRLGWAMVGGSAVLVILRVVAPAWSAPRGVVLIDFLLCTGTLCAGRVAARMLRERLHGYRTANGNGGVVQEIGIIGAGHAGASLAKDFLTNPARGFKPVVFFDDDETKHGKLVHGVPIIGKPEAIAEVKSRLFKVVIAMPSASAKRVSQVAQIMREHGLKVETLPSLTDLTSGRVKSTQIRPIEVEDLLGRDPVELDSEGIRRSIMGRVVLVTGAGGSIGSELCRQIAELAPQQLLLVEQAEGSLFQVEQELNELGRGLFCVPLVGDILDEERMRYIFSHYRPEVVFHAAAHKHVFMMERQPAEAIRNNVLGTRLLAEIAVDTGVDRFILISTDKAINPTNVMGATKRLAELQLMAIAATQEERRAAVAARTSNAQHRTSNVEVAAGDQRHAAEMLLRAVAGAKSPAVIGYQVAAPNASTGNGAPLNKAETLTADMLKSANPISSLSTLNSQIISSRAPRRATKFIAVRFGNVLGSSGSVVPIFKRQIAHGGPVTVTHRDVTRYFMTISEAVGLVLQSSILGRGGEIFVLDMGRPVKIVDLATQMIELSGFKVGDDIEIKFTGLKPGEKLFEELQHKNEQYTATEHPAIMRFTTNAMFSESGVQELKQRLYELDSNQLKNLLKRLVPEYTPFLD